MRVVEPLLDAVGRDVREGVGRGVARGVIGLDVLETGARVLVQVAWLGQRYNPWMQAVFEQVRRGSDANKKIAIVAVARKLTTIMYAMLKTGQEFNEDLVAAIRSELKPDLPPESQPQV